MYQGRIHVGFLYVSEPRCETHISQSGGWSLCHAVEVMDTVTMEV